MDSEIAGINTTENESAMMSTKYGFVPTSVWYFVKTQMLQTYVDDEMASGTYSRDKPQKNNLSQFNPVVAEKIIKIWSKEGDRILDPFAGRCRALIARHMRRNYVGYEISKKAYDQFVERLNRPTLMPIENVETKVINADARTIAYKDAFNMVFSCPPYWDVEDYNDAYEEKTPGQLSDLHKYEDFLVPYEEIIKKLYPALKWGGYVVWVVADIRRDKHLIPFAADTIKIFQRTGFHVHDIIINKINTLAVMGVGSALANGYTPKAHEYILVFKK